MELCALEAKGQHFTWMNRREDDYFIMERLNRAFASVEWINSYPQYALYNHPIIRSDHGSILLEFEVQLPFRRRPFRFERMWSSHEDCGDVVKAAWAVNTIGSRAFNLQYKINNIKKTFNEWNRRVFGKVEREIKDKQKILQNLQNSIQTLMDVRNEKLLREDIENLIDREEIKWAQKARSNWIIQGDRNTKYFQTIVNQRRARNRITLLKRKDGSNTNNIEEIEDLLVKHFKDKFYEPNSYSFESILENLSTLPIPKLSQQHVLQLDCPISNDEIEMVVFQLGAHKAPGPDGIPAFFFQEYWAVVKQDIFKASQAFFHLGSLLKALNKTFITLIPKVSVLEEVTLFRPISLCNFTYKIITKIMVNRLKPLMNSLISPFQNVFIQGRNISNNILLAHEIMDIMRKKKGRKKRVWGSKS